MVGVRRFQSVVSVNEWSRVGRRRRTVRGALRTGERQSVTMHRLAGGCMRMLGRYVYFVG